MKSKVYCELTVKSKRNNIDELSNILSVQHSDKHHIGDKSKTGITLDYSQWSFCTSTIEVFDIEEISKQFLHIIQPHIKELEKYIIGNNCESEICFVVYEAGDSKPALCISKDIIKLANNINAVISIDGVY
jgi:hypothetical protein